MKQYIHIPLISNNVQCGGFFFFLCTGNSFMKALGAKGLLLESILILVDMS